MEELELRQYWRIIRKRMTLMLAIPIIAAIVSAAVSFFVLSPKYEASTTLLINQKANDNPALEYQAVMANQAMVTTYSTIIKSATIESSVTQDLKLPYTPAQLGNMVTVSSPDQSQVIEVDVTAGSQMLATKIANAFGSVFQQRAQTLMDVQNVQIVDKAVVTPDAAPVKPNKKLNVAIAMILGLMVSIGLAFLLEYLDNRIRTEEDVQRFLDLPVLGVIGDYAVDGDSK
jgi:capsular polysaccharide biosynthesis protein